MTKFSYLKESLEPHVCEAIDGLPFTTEGYESAKNILKSNYGKTSEIVRAYVDNINALPIVYGSHPSKIHQFCVTLNYNVQSLEILFKQAFYKTIGGGMLSWFELSDVVLEVEAQLSEPPPLVLR